MLKPKTVRRVCKTHGEVDFYLENRGFYRCLFCRRSRTIAWRKKSRAKLLELFGNKCEICGYNRYCGALEFHHIYPEDKEFALSGAGQTLSFGRMLAEARKCILVCANCHREIEAGILEIPQELLDRVSKPS